MSIYNSLRVLKWKLIRAKSENPPHVVKQLIITNYVKKYKYNTLIETGTYFGEMINAQRDNFKKIYSIELSYDLYQKAKNRFQAFSHIELINGDSGEKIKQILQQLNEPAVFWLDGHYSEGITAKGNKNTPIEEELLHITIHPYPHIILIDDARLFNNSEDYPTVEKIKEIISKNRVIDFFKVADDIIQIKLK